MRSRRNLDAYEARRLRAISLFEQGHRPTEIAGIAWVSRQAVSQWLKAWRLGGLAALARVRHKGRPPRLDATKLRRLAAMLRKGAKAYGYPDDHWNSRRVADLILRRLSVSLHRNQIPRLLRSLHKPASNE
jgi:transposase